jgi:hypothetical protein
MKVYICINVYVWGLSGPKKLLILSMNNVLCYFSQSIILQGNARMFGRNINKSKVKVKVRMKYFFAHAFENFCITIWSCMKLEVVLKVLPMLILDTFVDQFVFFGGCEQCSKIFDQISPGSYYYLKDLKCVYMVVMGRKIKHY